MKRTGRLYPQVSVDSGPCRAVGQAGGVLLTRTVDVTGLGGSLSSGLARWRKRFAVHDPGKIITDLAVSLVLGGDCLAVLVPFSSGIFFGGNHRSHWAASPASHTIRSAGSRGWYSGRIRATLSRNHDDDPVQPTRSANTVDGMSGVSVNKPRTLASTAANDVTADRRSYFGGASDLTALITVVREMPNLLAIAACGTSSAASLLISAQSSIVITLPMVSGCPLLTGETVQFFKRRRHAYRSLRLTDDRNAPAAMLVAGPTANLLDLLVHSRQAAIRHNSWPCSVWRRERTTKFHDSAVAEEFKLARQVLRGTMDGQAAVVIRFDDGRTRVSWGGQGRPDGPGSQSAEVFGLGPLQVDFSLDNGAVVPLERRQPLGNARARGGADSRPASDPGRLVFFLAGLSYPRRFGTELIIIGAVLLVCVLILVLLNSDTLPLIVTPLGLLGLGFWWRSTVDKYLNEQEQK